MHHEREVVEMVFGIVRVPLVRSGNVTTGISGSERAGDDLPHTAEPQPIDSSAGSLYTNPESLPPAEILKLMAEELRADRLR